MSELPHGKIPNITVITGGLPITRHWLKNIEHHATVLPWLLKNGPACPSSPQSSQYLDHLEYLLVEVNYRGLEHCTDQLSYYVLNFRHNFSILIGEEKTWFLLKIFPKDEQRAWDQGWQQNFKLRDIFLKFKYSNITLHKQRVRKHITIPAQLHTCEIFSFWEIKKLTPRNHKILQYCQSLTYMLKT